MADIVLDNVTKRFPDGALAGDDISLDIAHGEFVILVGPSGCGKSTTLNMIAGLEDISSGELRIGGKVVNDKAPKDRDIAMVFQSYALYPHMTVRENMAFALKLAKAPKAEIDQKVNEAARVLDLEPYLDRRPAHLSGGQRQRVAVGRAIVRDPAAFLMDEPLSNLDAKLRVEMRAYLGRLHQELGTTTVYVTHDQVEAMTMGDRVAVMRAGRIVQADVPQALYDRPVDLFVAGFMGSPAMNLVRGRMERGDGGLEAVLGHQRLRVPPERTGLAAYEGREVVVGIRPEVFEVSMNGAGAGRQLVLPVLLTEALGSDLLVHLDLDAPPVITGDMLAIARELPTHGLQITSEADTHTRITARIPPGANARAGDTLSLLVDPNRLHFFDPETELAIA